MIISKALSVVLAAAVTALTMVGCSLNGGSYMKKYEDKIMEMPPDGAEDIRDDIVYPEFQKYTYYSTTARRDTNVNVLLPPNYSEDNEYPVLYILHGYWDSEDWMARPIVSISAMLSNLYESGEAEEMIVVCPYIFCSSRLSYCTGMDFENNQAYDNFINDLTADLMPFIESTFSAKTGRENTAITGFSMGGRESLYIGFSHPELFGYIGAVCPAPGIVSADGSGQLMSINDMMPEENKPYMLLISAAEYDGVVGNIPSTYHDLMEEYDVEHIWHVMSSTGHDHTSVKPHLYNFFRVIFKN